MTLYRKRLCAWAFCSLTYASIAPLCSASDLYWDFSTGHLPTGWITPELSESEVPVVGWQVFAGKLSPNRVKDVIAVIQTPAFRFGPGLYSTFGIGLRAGSGSASGAGSGELHYDTSGANEQFLIELLRLDAASRLVETLLDSNQDPDLTYFGPWESPDLSENPDIVPEGTYSVRMTAYDFDVLYTVSVHISDLLISNAVLVGDYNLNGTIDAADYTVWRDTHGNMVPIGQGADGSGNALIDQGDHLVWQANYGSTANVLGTFPPSITFSVPEPTTSAVFSLIFVLLQLRIVGLRRGSL